jgi:hypothetical protein
MTQRFILYFFISLFLALVVWSCVDIPSSGELPPDYKATVRFINVATDVGAGVVRIDGVAKGSSLSLRDASPYYSDVAAGGRKLRFGSDTLVQNVRFLSNEQHTVLIVPLSGTTRFLNLDEGYNFRNNAKAGVAQVRFINAAQGSSSVSFRDSAASGNELAARGYVIDGGYTDVRPGNHNIYAISAGGDTATFNGDFASGRRYTIVATRSGGSLQISRFTERQYGLTKAGSAQEKE